MTKAFDVDGEGLNAKIRQALSVTAEGLICAYLYGSHARSQASADSDIDLAVMLASQSDTGLVGPLSRLRGELERALNREVDLVDLRKAPPDLVHRILRDGHLIVDREPDQRIAFEVQARNAYFDLLPYLHEYRSGQAA